MYQVHTYIRVLFRKSYFYFVQYTSFFHKQRITASLDHTRLNYDESQHLVEDNRSLVTRRCKRTNTDSQNVLARC